MYTYRQTKVIFKSHFNYSFNWYKKCHNLPYSFMDLVLQVGSVVVVDNSQEDGHEHVQTDDDEDHKEYAQPE